MSTQFSRAYLVTSALILSLVTTAVLPATSVYAASKGAEHRSSVAAAHSKAPNRSASSTVNADNTATPSVEHSQASAHTTAPVQDNVRAVNTPTHSPAGNNGFIKVNEEVTPDSIPNNDPHVGCQFKVEFYNYDQNPNNRARVAFALHNPTAGDGYSLTTTGNLNPVIGGDAAGGGNDLDAVETYRLSFTGEPHDKQGYHVKLTIHADGSRGADVKHKVFWVQPCQGQVLGSTDGGQILATSTTRPASTPLPATLPSTGTNPYGFVITLAASVTAYVLAFAAQRLRILRANV